MQHGTVLGPLLLIIYLNYLHTAIDNDYYQTIQYADHTFLFSSICNENIARSFLEKFFEELCYYFQSNQLMMSNKKTEYIVFAPPKKEELHHISF